MIIKIFKIQAYMKTIYSKILSVLLQRFHFIKVVLFFRPTVVACTIFLFMGFNENVFGQSTEGNVGTVLKDWEQLHVSNPSLQVFFNVLDCNQNKRMGLKLINRTATNHQATFRIDIFDNRTGVRISKDLNISLAANQELKGDCQNIQNAQLLLELPADIDPNKIYVALTF